MANSAQNDAAAGGYRFDSAEEGQLTIPNIELQRLPHLTDFIPDLQPHPNPLDNNPFFRPVSGFYIRGSDVILRNILHDISDETPTPGSHLAYHRAGPRKQVYFDAGRVRAAIVTCGGLCPGMNTVIRELVVGLWELYGVRQIFGVPAGYRGFYSGEPVELNPKIVHEWHKKGGTALETSRGGFDLDKIVNGIQDRGFNQVFFFFSFTFKSYVLNCNIFMEYIYQHTLIYLVYLDSIKSWGRSVQWGVSR